MVRESKEQKKSWKNSNFKWKKCTINTVRLKKKKQGEKKRDEKTGKNGSKTGYSQVKSGQVNFGKQRQYCFSEEFSRYTPMNRCDIKEMS